MDKILVTIVGAGLIGFIYWFFFGGKKDPPSRKASERQEKEVVHVHN